MVLLAAQPPVTSNAFPRYTEHIRALLSWKPKKTRTEAKARTTLLSPGGSQPPRARDNPHPAGAAGPAIPQGYASSPRATAQPCLSPELQPQFPPLSWAAARPGRRRPGRWGPARPRSQLRPGPARGGLTSRSTATPYRSLGPIAVPPRAPRRAREPSTATRGQMAADGARWVPALPAAAPPFLPSGEGKGPTSG